MRTYKLTIAYDGTGFRGWQRQPDTDRTIQGILERVVSEKSGYPVEVIGSGRTDGGVHASGQTASLTLKGLVEPEYFLDGINAALPENIRILDACLMPNSFHARRSACWKAYEYYVDTAQRADVFDRRYTFHYPEKLSIEKMCRAAGYLTGTHGFGGFTDRPDETSTKRTIYAIIITGQGSRVSFRYEGSGFMYHMVRILTGTLLDVGTGARSPESVLIPLQTEERWKAGFLAPAQGLFLKEVYYEHRQHGRQ